MDDVCKYGNIIVNLINLHDKYVLIITIFKKSSTEFVNGFSLEHSTILRRIWVVGKP